MTAKFTLKKRTKNTDKPETFKAPSKLSPFEVAKNINKKSGYMVDISPRDIDHYMLDNIFSKTIDTVFFANESNKMRFLPTDVSAEMVYAFYYFSTSKNAKRFGTWHKKEKVDSLDKKTIDAIVELYGYNHMRAKEVLSLLSDDQKKKIISNTDKGGTN